jgi:hypothetical protein
MPSMTPEQVGGWLQRQIKNTANNVDDIIVWVGNARLASHPDTLNRALAKLADLLAENERLVDAMRLAARVLDSMEYVGEDGAMVITDPEALEDLTKALARGQEGT